MPATPAHGKFAASQHSGEFAGTSHSQSFYPIEKKFIRQIEDSNQKIFNWVITKIRILLKIIIMTVVIKRYADKASIRKLLGTLPKVSKFDPKKFCGALKLRRSPLDIQKEMRNEWQ